MKTLLKITTAILFVANVTAVHAEQWLGAPGDQGKAMGLSGGYQGTVVGYFQTKAMSDAFKSAAHLRSAGVLVKAVEKKDAAGRTMGWQIGAKYYAMAYGPIQKTWTSTDYSKYNMGIPNSGSWDYIGGGAWSFVPSSCTSQGCN